VQATGDPHLLNIHGQKFDLKRPGKYTFIQIPKAAKIHHYLLRVTALAAMEKGGACADMYIKDVNITGKWVKAHAGHHDRIRFLAGHPDRGSTWEMYGPISLKVAMGKTASGIKYLNLLVKGLHKVGHSVGGLLGDTDHTLASTPSAACHSTIV